MTKYNDVRMQKKIILDPHNSQGKQSDKIKIKIKNDFI